LQGTWEEQRFSSTARLVITGNNYTLAHEDFFALMTFYGPFTISGNRITFFNQHGTIIYADTVYSISADGRTLTLNASNHTFGFAGTYTKR